MAPDSTNSKPGNADNKTNIVGIVKEAYSTKAREGVPADCNGSSQLYLSQRSLMRLLTDAKRVAQAFGYTEEQLLTIPEGASLGLSCGNPVASASLKKVPTCPDSASVNES